MANSEWKVSAVGHSPFATHYSPLPQSHRPDLDHVGHKMLEQVLDAVLQRRGGGRAARAGALHVEIDDAVLEAAEGDVAAVVGDRRSYPCLDQVLDGGNRLSVVFAEKLILFVG